MNLVKITILLLILPITVVANEQYLIKQGDIKITFYDVDGFSKKIPIDKRNGFFNSPQRIDQTLTSLLTMKHMVNYANNLGYLDNNEIEKTVEQRLINNTIISESDNTIDQNIDYKKIKDYYILEESYRKVQNHVKLSVTEIDVLELAREEYLITKEKYYHEETRDIDYINLIYNDNNKEQQYIKINEIKSKLNINDVGFLKIKELYKDDKSDIEFVTGINEYYFNDNFQKFSEFVFKNNKVGILDDVLDANSRFVIAVIKNIDKKGYKPFNEVKKEIVKVLMKEKVEREFGFLVTKLTQDKVEIDKDAVFSLRERYSTMVQKEL